MKKLKTLLPKSKDGKSVIDGDITVNNITHFSLKIDGTSCMIKNGSPYCRYDAKLFKRKRGKIIRYSIDEVKSRLPSGAIACSEPDSITGHWPHWVHVDSNNPAHKYILEGFDGLDNKIGGTYECIGDKINGNPHGIEGHKWVHHQSKDLVVCVEGWQTAPFDFFQEYLMNMKYEGLIAYNKLEPLAKIRRSDFGYPPIKYSSELNGRKTHNLS